MDTFLSTVSHELRGPLNIMLGWIGLLSEDQALNSEQREMLELINRNALMQSEILNDLIDISRLTSGKFELNFKDIHLPSFIEQNLKCLELMARRKNITLSHQIKGSVSSIVADPLRLRQIIVNLINNAIKFTPAGGSIFIELSDSDNYFALKIHDTGRGISPEFLPRVFERYSQERSQSQREEGLGLGLAIVRDLVEAHGGEIAAFSEGLNRGTAVVIRLPKKPAKESNTMH